MHCSMNAVTVIGLLFCCLLISFKRFVIVSYLLYCDFFTHLLIASFLRFVCLVLRPKTWPVYI